MSGGISGITLFGQQVDDFIRWGWTLESVPKWALLYDGAYFVYDGIILVYPDPNVLCFGDKVLYFGEEPLEYGDLEVYVEQDYVDDGYVEDLGYEI